MCAIVSMIDSHVPEGCWQQRHRLIESLLLAAQRYGPDATGFVAATAPFKRPHSGQLVIDKAPCKSSEYVRTCPAWRSIRQHRCEMILGHTRWATQGKPDNPKNNHPFLSRDGRFFLVHNGILTNHPEIDRRYELRRNGQCDSESLLRLIEQIGSPRLGLAACLQEFQGSMAIIVYDAKNRLLWTATNGGRPLWFCRLRNWKGWLIASTNEILCSGLRKTYGDSFERHVEIMTSFAPNVIHALSACGQMIAAGQVMSKRPSVVPETTPGDAC